jgi:hypothetical protein
MNRETIMTALYERLQTAPMIFDFTADLRFGEVALSNLSDTSGLFEGLPVFGRGIDEGTVLATVDPPTLSRPAKATGHGVSIRQGFRTVGRRLLEWDKCEEQPAMFVCDGDELHPPRAVRTEPAFIVLSAEVYLYSRAGEDPDAVPAAAINRMIDAFEMALDPPPNASNGVLQRLGLRGVIYCRIEGDLVKASGNGGAQAVALVPIKIAVVQSIATR